MQTFFCLYICCCFQISLHWYAAFSLSPPPPMKCRNRLIAKYAKMLLYTVLVFEEWVWLGDTSPCLRGEWLSVWTGGGGSRDGRQNRAQPFALHVFPCTIQALCFCWKTLFSLSFCLVKQPSLNFSVSSSTNKGSEVTASFWGGDYHIVRFVFQLGVFDLQALESNARKPSCNFANVTFQLWRSSDR